MRVYYRNVQRRLPKVRQVLRRQPAVLALGEPFDLAPRLRRLVRYRYVGGDSKGERDTPILVRRTRRVIDSGTRMLSREVPGHEGVAHDRYATWVRLRLRGRVVTIINVHLTPLRAGLPAVNSAHHWGGIRLEQLVTEMLRHGEVIVTGDLNRQAGRGINGGLAQVLTVRTDDVSVIAWSNGLTQRRVRRGARLRRAVWWVLKSPDHNSIGTDLVPS